MATLVSRIADLAASVRDKINLKANLSDTVVVVSTATYTVLTSNNGKLHEYTNAAGCLVTLPNDLPLGWNSLHAQMALGKVTFQAAAGATVHGYGSLATPGQFGEISLRVRSNIGGTAAVYNLGGGDGGASSGGIDLSDLASFKATFNGSQAVGGGGFITVTMDTIVYDSHNGWNVGSNAWVVPPGQAGKYDAQVKYRLNDGYTNGISIGIGVDIANRDTPTFVWDVSKPNRQGTYNSDMMDLVDGQAVRLFYYIDGPNSSIIGASLTLMRQR